MNRMETIMGKLGMYDILARIVTGSLVILGAQKSGVVDVLNKLNTVSIFFLLVGAYGLGIILEEFSYLLESKIGLRKQIEQDVWSQKKYILYDYEKCKAALQREGKEAIAEITLGHIVMADELKIAYTVILIWKVLNIAYHRGVNTIDPTLNVLLLEGVIILFHVREKHYCRRRVEEVFDHCIANHYKDIYKTGRQ